MHRFDRTVDGHRLPFISAMSMLDARDNELHSYFELADALRRHGASPKDDMHATWRRQAGRLGLKTAEIDRMASAFEHNDLRLALKIRTKI